MYQKKYEGPKVSDIILRKKETWIISAFFLAQFLCLMDLLKLSGLDLYLDRIFQWQFTADADYVIGVLFLKSVCLLNELFRFI